MAELSALAADLPAGGPKVDPSLLESGEVLCFLADDFTKAAYFLMMRVLEKEAKDLRVAELKLELKQAETGQPFDDEQATMTARRFSHTVRHQAFENLLWTGVKGQIAPLLGGRTGSIALGPNWEIMVLPPSEDSGVGGAPFLLEVPRRRRRGQ